MYVRKSKNKFAKMIKKITNFLISSKENTLLSREQETAMILKNFSIHLTYFHSRRQKFCKRDKSYQLRWFDKLLWLHHDTRYG